MATYSRRSSGYEFHHLYPTSTTSISIHPPLIPHIETPVPTSMHSIQSTALRPSPLGRLHQPYSSTLIPTDNAKPRAPKSRPFTMSASATTVSAPKRETDPKKRVVITGMGLVSVFGNDVDAYYDKLLAGESGITPIDRFDASKFPTRFGGQIRGFKSEGYIDGKNDRRLDDCLRYCIVAGKKALESSDLGGERLNKVYWIFEAELIVDRGFMIGIIGNLS